MRTKTLLLTAALAVGGVASSMAQAVYSQNVVGYINVTVAANAYAAVGNQLNNGTNTLDEILPNAPANTTRVFEFNPATSSFNTYTKRSTGWAGAAGIPFAPGKGFFINNTATTPITLTFVGEVPEGTKNIAIGNGFNLVGSAFPLSGAVETQLGLPAVNGNRLYKFNTTTQGYDVFTRRATAWAAPGEPSAGVGESFFFEVATGATNWSKTYTVPRP